jgi:hypothetical protein
LSFTSALCSSLTSSGTSRDDPADVEYIGFSAAWRSPIRRVGLRDRREAVDSPVESCPKFSTSPRCSDEFSTAYWRALKRCCSSPAFCAVSLNPLDFLMGDFGFVEMACAGLLGIRFEGLACRTGIGERRGGGTKVGPRRRASRRLPHVFGGDVGFKRGLQMDTRSVDFVKPGTGQGQQGVTCSGRGKKYPG